MEVVKPGSEVGNTIGNPTQLSGNEVLTNESSSSSAGECALHL